MVLTIEYSFYHQATGLRLFPGSAIETALLSGMGFKMGSFQWKCVENKEQNGFAIVNFFGRDRHQRRPCRIEQGSQETDVLAPLVKSVAFKRNRGDWKSLGYVFAKPQSGRPRVELLHSARSKLSASCVRLTQTTNGLLTETEGRASTLKTNGG
jgi:hypothetical protein